MCCEDAVWVREGEYGVNEKCHDLLQWRVAASSTAQGCGGQIWCPGTGSKSPREDAKGGVGTAGALSCRCLQFH